VRRFLRWARNVLLALVAIVLLAYSVIYFLSQQTLRRAYGEPLVSLTIPTDSASIVEGKRLAQLRGCSGGCHGHEIEGETFLDDPLLAHIVAPNLTEAVRRYSDPDLARIIRRGVRPDSHTVVVMPAEMFSVLTDADVAKILAYLRSVPRMPGPLPDVRLGPLARLGVVLKQYEPAVALVHRADSLTPTYPAPGDATAPGAYLARTSCTECHGVGLTGAHVGDQTSPDLKIVAGYSSDAFTRLLRTGKGLGDRELGMMSEVARGRFTHFTDAEIAALRTYLLARARAGAS
jgi:mono/diheme cytochrome c family protein